MKTRLLSASEKQAENPDTELSYTDDYLFHHLRDIAENTMYWAEQAPPESEVPGWLLTAASCKLNGRCSNKRLKEFFESIVKRSGAAREWARAVQQNIH